MVRKRWKARRVRLQKWLLRTVILGAVALVGLGVWQYHAEITTWLIGAAETRPLASARGAPHLEELRARLGSLKRDEDSIDS